MAADYPDSVTSFTDQINKTSPTVDEYHLDAADFNDAYDEIVAIEQELGTNPRGIKADVTARLDYVDFFLVPEYGIILWHGLISEIPGGWTICDGTADTPDLRGKFIKGAAEGIDPGNTGGSPTKNIAIANLPSHNHTGSSGSTGGHNHSMNGAGGHDHGGSVTGGSHNHTIRVYNALWVAGGPNGPFYPVRSTSPYTNSTDAIRDKSHSHTLNVASASGHTHTNIAVGNHSHTVSVGYTGSGTALNVEPAYYELIFLMKTP